MLAQIEAGGQEKAREYGQKLDGWEGEIVVSDEMIEQACAQISQQMKDDLQFAYERIRLFAERAAKQHG